MLLRSENKVVWIHGANVLFLSVILMVLLGPLEICRSILYVYG